MASRGTISTSAAAAEASPASTERLRRSTARVVPRRAAGALPVGVHGASLGVVGRPWRCARLAGVSAHLPDLLRRAAAASPDRVALVEASGRRVTWAELDAEVDAVAHGLNAHGLVAGYRVVVATGQPRRVRHRRTSVRCAPGWWRSR